MNAEFLGQLSAVLFRPLRRLFGPLHRRRNAFSADQEERQKNLPPLPPPWNEDDRWYRGDFPPHRHNRLQPLPHGSDYFADLYRALGEAQSRVTIAGWCLTPLMPLLRGDDELASIFADVIHEVSERADVYILLWCGAPALFEPNTHTVEAVRKTLLDRAPKVRCELDRNASFSHDHHQKAVTIDGRVAYVGGMGISTFQGDRWDTQAHALRFGPGWHDVQVRVEGEIVRDVEQNFCQRWNAVTGTNLQPLQPEVDAAWDTPAQLVRTVPKGFYPTFAPDGHYGIRHALLAAIKRSRRYVYLENQYLWAPEVVDALCVAMDRPHPDGFRIVVVLPARAYSGRYDNDEHVRKLREADNGRGIFEAYSLYSSGPAEGTTGYRYLPIYVHAKVSIVDDEWFMIGSANLNRRGLGTDTEIAVQSVAPDIARSLRINLWAEHLEMREEEIANTDPIELVDGPWKQRAAALARCRRSGGPPAPGQAHRYEPGGTPQSRLLDRIQSMTLEH